MSPRSCDNHHDMTLFDEECLVERAAYELEGMKIAAANGRELQPLPQACFEVIKTLPGNNNCIDCGASKPDWATVSYGALICMHCCANHRSLGVEFSKVRSLTMDHWSHQQVLKMLEGGNQQLKDFFSRHALSTEGENGESNLRKRYRTKAAKFYQRGIDKHTTRVMDDKIYRGREAYRSQTVSTQAQSQ